jgi:translation initiation factor IF-2
LYLKKRKKRRKKTEEEKIEKISQKLEGPKVLGKIDLGKKTVKEEPKVEKEEPKVVEPVKEEKKEPILPEKEVEKPEVEEVKQEEKPAPPEKPEIELIGAKADKLSGPTVLGKIELPKEPIKKEKTPHPNAIERKKRKRTKVSIQKVDPKIEAKKTFKKDFKKGKEEDKKEISQKEVQEQLKQTLARMQSQKGSGFTGSKYRKEKRSQIAREAQEQQEMADLESKILKVTEFVSANELASMMDVSVNEVIATCMSLGMFVSINQRLDAEAITVISDEFGYEVKFVDADDKAEAVEEIVDKDEDLVERAPIVTIMGHVDHGKTSLLDFIRNANVTAGEAGGITQHIGAYSVMTESGKRISFLDTPGHEAFTAMRARGAQLTDVVIIVVAADDAVMPQTKEAINHAKAAGVPIIIAINKVDKETANPEKIKEQLANENILVEDWGGKYQCQHISAKTGAGVFDLLEKVLLETEMLELKANPKSAASGTVVEAALDKGRGYVTTVLVQRGTLKIGDILLAGSHYGRVKAMTDHTGKRLKEAGPSTPVQILGLDGAPQAGDKFQVKETEREAREIASKRAQILREQNFRTKKHITLDEIGRRLAVGDFKELNIIIKGDVDGSVEALSDSLLKLSTNEVAINILQKGVGQISESDVLLATASDAIIIGFQVRPSTSAKKLAEAEEIQIKLYSVIYAAIEDVKDAMEGMLAPKEEEVICW